MNDRTKDEFLVRFYRWAMKDALREISEGCPLIRSVRGIASSEFIEHIDSLSEPHRIELIKVLVKRMHPKAVEICGASLSEHEEEVYQKYLSEIRELTSRYVDQYVIKTKSKADKRRLKSILQETLLGTCGPIVRKNSSELWDHATTIEGWSVFTEIDLGGSAQLRYSHYIRESLQSTGNLNGVGSITLLGWLGISSETKWNLLREGDEEVGVTSLERICAHFMNALPSLLRGLK